MYVGYFLCSRAPNQGRAESVGPVPFKIYLASEVGDWLPVAWLRCADAGPEQKDVGGLSIDDIGPCYL